MQKYLGLDMNTVDEKDILYGRVEQLWIKAKEKNLDEVNELAIWEVACLMHKDPDVDKINFLMKKLRAGCQDLYIVCEGSPSPGLEKKPLEDAPTKPIIKMINGKLTVVDNEALFFTKKPITGFEAILTKDVVQQYLESRNQWPLEKGVLLSKWFNDGGKSSVDAHEEHICTYGGEDDTKDEITSIKKKRKTNLKRAVLEAIDSFDCKPTLDELWEYFLKDGDTTGHIQDFTDDVLTWVDTKGKLHDTTKKTVANMLSSINVQK